MKQGEKEVFSKQQKVGVAIYSIYDSVDEAVERIGPEETLALINAQEKTNQMNAVREGASPRTSKKALRAKAMASIIPEEFAEVAGDMSRIEALIQAKMKELEDSMPIETDAEAEVIEA